MAGISEETKAAIAWLFNEDRPIGTAFYIGGDYVLTAYHNLKRKDSNTGAVEILRVVDVNFCCVGFKTPAKVVPEFQNPKNDWALLKCDAVPPAVRPIPFAKPPPGGGRVDWVSFGYPDVQPTPGDDGRDGPGLVIEGHIVDPNSEYKDAHALQLFCEFAAAGTGAPLHGFSGAPCLVEGAAIGVLRSTLVESLPDGEYVTRLHTTGGTAYACPSLRVVEHAGTRSNVELPNGWQPRFFEFIVVLPERKGQDSLLVDVAKEAAGHIVSLSPPRFFSAAEQLESDKFEELSKLLCRARVVVFDVTDFEPAVMLFIGIRAAVRRSVTILSAGGAYTLGKAISIPFNLHDANLISHSPEQGKDGGTDPVKLLAQRIRFGLAEGNSPYYADMPVFDALRNLPIDQRGIIPTNEGVIVLCSFDEEYTRNNWNAMIKAAFNNELAKLRAENAKIAQIGVARSLELTSSRLVTRTVYEHIRRMQACVVDFTRWSPSVLFEFGVRLVASSNPTACIVQKGNVDERFPEQCSKIVSLFVANEMQYDLNSGWLKQAAFKRAYGNDASFTDDTIAGGGLHQLIAQVLDVDAEPASLAVFEELKFSSDLFRKLPGRSKPVGLFPQNRTLVDREEEADFERLLAAWLYMHRRIGEPKVMLEEKLRSACKEIISALLGRHPERLKALPDFHGEVTAMADCLESAEKGNA